MENVAVLEQGSSSRPSRRDQVDAGLDYSTKVTKYFDVLGSMHGTTGERKRGDTTVYKLCLVHVVKQQIIFQKLYNCWMNFLKVDSVSKVCY